MEKLPEKKNDVLKKLIKPDLLEPAPVDFTKNVMSSLGIEPVKPVISVQPIISGKGWFLISLITFGIYLILFLSADTASGDSQAGIASRQVLQQFENAFTATFSGPGMIFICMAATAIFLLFLAESFFRQSRMRTFNV